MIIEKVKHHEIDALMPFWEAQTTLHHQVDPTYTYPVTPAISKAIYELLDSSFKTNYYEIFAAKHNEEMIGFVAYRFDKTDLFYTKMNHFGEIYNILVKDSVVKQGVGKKLMAFAEDKMREKKIPYAMLVANPHNTNGFGFYKHLGYVPKQAQFFKKLSTPTMPVSNDVDIMPLAANQVDELLTLWQQQVDFHYNLDNVYGIPFSKEATSAISKIIDKILSKTKDHTLLVALKAGKIVGFIDYELQQCDHFYTPIKQYGQIVNVFVQESNRGQRIGQALMAKAEKDFLHHNMEYAMLWAMPGNKNAIQFYEQLGYECKQVQMFKTLS